MRLINKLNELVSHGVEAIWLSRFRADQLLSAHLARNVIPLSELVPT